MADERAALAKAAPSNRNAPASPATINRRNNVLLFSAMVVAMLAGAFGGIVLSSRHASEAQMLSYTEIAERNSPAVVFIRVEYELINSEGQVIPMAARTGSGFVISTDGLIVTNRHVIRDWEYNAPAESGTWRTGKIEVFFPHQGRAKSTPARVEKLSAIKEIDVAILKAESDHLPAVEAIETDLSRINQGDDVVVLGYPLGMQLLDMTNDQLIEPSLSTGVVSRIGQDTIQLQLRAYRGHSGGPVLNRRGQVIGIITANATGAQDLTFATPFGAAMEMLQQQ
jgi:S1-C subfamily serine protease